MDEVASDYETIVVVIWLVNKHDLIVKLWTQVFIINE